MKGGFTSKQIIYVDIPAPGNGVKQEEEILMVENVWKYFNSVSSESVSRSDFMSVLSNVEYILIKASYGQGLQQSRITNVSMEIAMKADDIPLARETTHLIEKCLCPAGYAGLSCQGCRDNTAGDRCNVCATGYYGKVTGSVNDCSLCACPRISPGRCSPGYYGNPEEPDGDCQPCQCNLNGSIHNSCDHMSGQCVCKRGVRGQFCDECEARHILVENECISCDDACTGLLLSDLDNLDKAMFLVNLTGAVIAPYGLLSDLENTTKHLKGSLLSKEVSAYSVETVYNRVVKLTGDTGQIHKELTRILQKGGHLSNATERNLNKSQELAVFIETLQTTVKVLVEVAASLNETLHTDLPFANRTFQDLQDEIPVMLKVMNGRYFKKLYQQTTLELKVAKRILTQIQKEYRRPQQELLDLKKAAKRALSNHNTRLQELKDLVDEASSNTNETKHLLLLLNNNIMQFSHKKLNILADKELSVVLTKEGKAHVDASAALAKDVNNITSTLEIHRDELILWNGKLRQHVDNLVMQMSTRGALDLVYKAEDHAADLQRLAHVLDSGLSNVRNISLNATNAVQAYSTIKSLTENAESLADDADRIITEQVILCSILSSRLCGLIEVSGVLHRLVSGLNEINIKVEKFKEKADGIAKQLNGSLLQMTALPNDTSENIIAVKELAVSANVTAINGLNHTGVFSEKLLNTSSALSKVNETLQKTNELIIDSSKAVASAERKVSEVEIQAGLLFGRLKPLKALEENLSRNISEIKELISQARKQAASIKVAVSAERDCIRAYQPQILSTNYNTLTLNVKTTEPDNLLFYLGSSGKTDFMAVEMRRGKVAFLWDIGSGSTRLEYPDLTINNNKWHRIHITSLQDEDTAFHFDGSGYSVVEKALRSTVTQIIVFFSTFSPNGLLVYLASNGTRDFLSLELVDGKVKLTVDLGSGPLTLKTERRYNNGTWYKISFSRNKKEGILAVMDAQNLSSKESKQGESPGTASDLNRSDKDPIYIGGLPRSRAVKKGITNRRYVGCIKNLEISRSTFDLLKNSYGVRKGCILEPIRTASILSNGYIELPPKPLSQESQLMATFITKKATGIILVGLGKGAEKRRRRQAHLPFFSIMLTDGHLVVHINAGDRGSTRKVMVQSTNGNYSDGQEHSVILTRNKRMIAVQVDENSPAEIRLGPLAESSPMNISNFYIGGIPAGENILGVKMTSSFHGCITNLIFNMALLDFATAVRYEGVDMDNCFLLEKPKSTIQPEDTEILSEMQMRSISLRPLNNIKEKQCAEDDLQKQIPGAHQFGLARRSHLVLLFNQTTVRKKFSVQMNLRTFASSGLIYCMTHPKQVDFAALQLHGGKLYFSFDLGKGRAVAFHGALISDGKWHTVKTEYAKRRGVIIVDGQESAGVNVPGDGITLDVDGKLYLGGLPLDYGAKNIGNITHSIPACIGEVTINSKHLDRESLVSSFAVNKCYVTAQEGTFFDGNGFAALVKEGYKVRSDVNITFEFRTTSANGILLGISSAKVDAIGLEIVNGKVLFCVNNGAGRITATYEPKGVASLCDGQWHKLQANKSKHQIALIVDGNLAQMDNPHTQSTSADTNNPIYVGGFPADVKQNCLSSKSSFRGCLRNLLLIKSQQVESFDFSEAFDLHGVFPHSCPGAEH
ncbi:UNVERIFIED_CONTAM: hypothetical protein K2H54_051811 [Gekko kuhli]